MLSANPAGCWGAGSHLQGAAAEPAEQTRTADCHQTHTVKAQTARGQHYFCTFCTTGRHSLCHLLVLLLWCMLSLFMIVCIWEVCLCTCVLFWQKSGEKFKNVHKLFTELHLVKCETWFKCEPITVFSWLQNAASLTISQWLDFMAAGVSLLIVQWFWAAVFVYGYVDLMDRWMGWMDGWAWVWWAGGDTTTKQHYILTAFITVPQGPFLK